MKVFLTTAYPTPWTYLPRFQQLAEQDHIHEHRVVSAPDEAEIILFVDARLEHGDWQMKAIRQHPLTQRYPGKAFVYNEMDNPWGGVPGLYMGMPASTFDSRKQRVCPYLNVVNEYVMEASQVTPDLLFSFMGRRGYPVRDVVLGLSDPRAYIEDTTSINFFGDANRPAEEMETQKKRYAEVIARSKFIVCPRGTGPSSFRLFETLAAGRVPVIISDEWVPPIGPDWEACSIWVREADTHTLPRLLESSEDRFEKMSDCARQTYADWFAPDIMFHRLLDSCEDILKQGRMQERTIIDRQYLRCLWRYSNGRAAMRTVKNKLLRLLPL